MAGARQKSALRLLAASKEAGYIDAAADYVLDTTGSVTLLNTVAQGCHPAWKEDRDEGPAVPWKSAKMVRPREL